MGQSVMVRRRKGSHRAAVSRPGRNAAVGFDEQPVPRSTANLFKRSSEGKIERKRRKRKQGFQPRPHESRSAFLRRVDERTREAVLKELINIDFTETSERTGNGSERKRCNALFSSIMNRKKFSTARAARFGRKKKLRTTSTT